MSHNRLPYMCYKMLRNLDENDRVTWASKVRELLFQYGFGHVWLSEDVGDINHFMKTFKQRLIDCSIQDWSARISESGKARHYTFIMPSLQAANYIFYNIPIKFRIALSKLKCSVHCLNVEVGRHNKIDYQTRLCNLCDKQEIEDEYYFVIRCPIYKNLRDIYLPSVDSDRSTEQLFYSLFNGNREQVLNLARFIYNAFKARGEKIRQFRY